MIQNSFVLLVGCMALRGLCRIEAFSVPNKINRLVKITENDFVLKSTTKWDENDVDIMDITLERSMENSTVDIRESTSTLQIPGDNRSSSSSPIPVYLPTLALCWFVGLLSSLDRVAMSVAILPMSDEYHLTDTIKGEVSSVFSIGYGLGILPVGLIVSTVSPKTIMAAGVALWSLATFGTPIAASFIQMVQSPVIISSGDIASTSIYMAQNIGPLLLIRALMGGAESVVLPAIQRILMNYIPPSKKSTAIAAILSGFQLGTVLAYLVSPWVMDNLGGWRGLFYIYGLIGAIWIIPWLLYAKDAPDVKNIIDLSSCAAESIPTLAKSKMEDDFSLVMEHHKLDENGDTSPDILDVKETLTMAFEEMTQVLKDAPWKDLFRSKAVWGMTVAHAANNWGLYNSLSWTPTFYAQQYGLNVKESAFLSILPSIAGVVGGLSAGFIADKVIETIGDESNIEKRSIIRKIFQAIALLGPASCLIAISSHVPEDATTAQFILMGTVGLQAFNAAGYGAGPQEKAGEKWSGLLYSITSLPGVVFGSIGVYATGQILDSTNQNWSVVFGLNAIIDILGGLAFVILYNSKKEFE